MSLFLSLACPLAVAGNFNGTKSLICSVKDGVEVYRNGRPQPFYPESVGLPEKFIIDFKNKLIRPTKDSVIQRRSRIKRMERIEEKTILQGVEDGVEGVDDGVGWSMAIYQKTGRFVITASGGMSDTLYLAAAGSQHHSVIKPIVQLFLWSQGQ